jgi:hypothetical protein
MPFQVLGLVGLLCALASSLPYSQVIFKLLHLQGVNVDSHWGNNQYIGTGGITVIQTMSIGSDSSNPATGLKTY